MLVGASLPVSRWLSSRSRAIRASFGSGCRPAALAAARRCSNSSLRWVQVRTVPSRRRGRRPAARRPLCSGTPAPSTGTRCPRDATGEAAASTSTTPTSPDASPRPAVAYRSPPCTANSPNASGREATPHCATGRGAAFTSPAGPHKSLRHCRPHGWPPAGSPVGQARSRRMNTGSSKRFWTPAPSWPPRTNSSATSVTCLPSRPASSCPPGSTRPLPGLSGVARRLTNDLDAVTAGFTLRWRSGATEGAVNSIKKIKRQLYGRVEFDLLQKMILLA